jgi:hypothetical protein
MRSAAFTLFWILVSSYWTGITDGYGFNRFSQPEFNVTTPFPIKK